jgi:ribosomal protein S27E
MHIPFFNDITFTNGCSKKGLTDSQMMNANTDIAYLLVGLLLLKKSHYFDVIIVHSDDRRHLLPLLSAILKNWIGYNTGRKIYVHELWLDASIEQSDGTGFNAINEFQQTALALSAYPHECPEEFHAVLCDECRRIQFNFSQIPRNTMFCDLCASTEAFSVAGNSSTVAANSAYYSVINDDDNSDVVDMGKIEDLLVLLQFRSLL